MFYWKLKFLKKRTKSKFFYLLENFDLHCFSILGRQEWQCGQERDGEDNRGHLRFAGRGASQGREFAKRASQKDNGQA